MTDEEIDLRFHRNRESQRLANIRYGLGNQRKLLWLSAKARASQRNQEFSISEADVVIPEKCIYLGCVLTNYRGAGRSWSNASIDRIDSTKGYVPGNVQVISDLANRMKAEAAQEQLIAFAKGVLAEYVQEFHPPSPEQGEVP